MFIQAIDDFPVNGASATPGLCYFCRSTKRTGDDGVMSTGVDVSTEGIIELCQPCVQEMAAQFGMIPATKAEELRANNRRLGLQVKGLEKRLADNDHLGNLISAAEEAARSAEKDQA